MSNVVRYDFSARSQNKKIKNLQQRIKSYESIFLVGAGISFESGIPLTRILKDLLTFIGASNFEEIADDEEKSFKFKQNFKKICDKKNFSKAHQSILTNFPEYIKEVICLNWDNMLEKCGKELFSAKNINKINEEIQVKGKNFIWKFHGDVDNVKKDNLKGKGGWIFPNETGYVFSCFMDYIKKQGYQNHCSLLS